jgi:predicted nucleic acid-binding protein
VRVFVDTSAFVALAVRTDAHHKRAAAFYRKLPPAATLSTSDYVVDETLTRLRKVAGHAAAVAVGRALRESTLARVVRLEPVDLDAAWALFQRYADKDLSFTDCTSVAAMERLRIPSIFTFDDDFAKIGVKVTP